MKISDIFLYSKKCFSSLNDKVFTLYIGILCIGFFDIVYTFVNDRAKWFEVRPFYSVFIAVLILVIVGIIDVVAFSMPLFDLLKYFRKLSNYSNSEEKLEEKSEDSEIKIDETKEFDNFELNSLLIKFMKVYIISHIAIVAVELVFWLMDYYTGAAQYSLFNNVFEIYVYYIVPIWFAAIITRGLMTVMEIHKSFTVMVFATVFSWNYLIAISVPYIKDFLCDMFFQM